MRDLEEDGDTRRAREAQNEDKREIQRKERIVKKNDEVC